ncbi:MAG TPA: hypothetical protein VI911_07805 [Patescibacteria group bacterium]|nr:hypothetical protein [Patescibacteria group bacterium]
MSCVKCNYTGETVFFKEEYPCKCGDTVIVDYNICPECGSFWRNCGDTLLDEVDIIADVELRDMMLAIEGIETLLGLDEDIPTNTMADCITRCVKCNSVSYKMTENKYKCPVCSTEWEVLAGV